MVVGALGPRFQVLDEEIVRMFMQRERLAVTMGLFIAVIGLAPQGRVSVRAGPLRLEALAAPSPRAPEPASPVRLPVRARRRAPGSV